MKSLDNCFVNSAEIPAGSSQNSEPHWSNRKKRTGRCKEAAVSVDRIWEKERPCFSLYINEMQWDSNFLKEQGKQVNLRIPTKLLMTEGVHSATQPFQQNSTQQQFHHKENMGEKWNRKRQSRRMEL